MRAALSSFLRDTRAAAAAEMALALPMLFALMFTMFEAGNYFLAEHKVLKGVREGARYAARQDLEYFNCTTGNLTNKADPLATAATTIKDQIQNVTVAGQTSGGMIRVQGWTKSDVNVTVSCGVAGTTYKTGLYEGISQTAAPKVLVSTAVPYQPLMGTLGFGWTPLLRAQSQAAVMGL